MNLGWIGCGNMGVRMVERLAKAGETVAVYNRTAAKTERVAATGERVMIKNNPAEIARCSDVIFTSITNDASMREVLYGENGLFTELRSGQILVEMSTFSPDFCAELKKILNDKGVLYLNAPVIGSMFMVEAGLLKVIASGDEAAFHAVRPFLEIIGKSATYLGEGCEARYMKIAVNMIICSYLTIYGEVLSAGEGLGFGWEELNDLLESSNGGSPMLKDKGTLHRQRIWGSETALTSTAMKDLGFALQCADSKGFSLPITAMVWQYDRFMNYNPAYKTYSTFGTIGLLENITGVTAGSGADESTKSVLTDSLVSITFMLSMEALHFCRENGISTELALDILGNCHGASAYFKEYSRTYYESNEIDLENLKRPVKEILDLTYDKGLFLPIFTVAWTQG